MYIRLLSRGKSIAIISHDNHVHTQNVTCLGAHTFTTDLTIAWFSSWLVSVNFFFAMATFWERLGSNNDSFSTFFFRGATTGFFDSLSGRLPMQIKKKKIFF